MLLLILLLQWSNIATEPGEMVIFPTKEEGIYTLIYKASEVQNVSVKVISENGEKRLEHNVEKTAGFSLPINMKSENSGNYRVVISANGGTVEKSFQHVEYVDKVKEFFSYEYNQERHKISVICSELINAQVAVHIFNELGEELMEERIKENRSINRVFNMDGAPAKKFELVIHADGKKVLDAIFDY